MTQNERVLKDMQDFGEISPLDAFRDLGVTRLASVVFELKKKGYDIMTETREAQNRWGDATRFAVYKLREKVIEIEVREKETEHE